jgi:hypothetical protein
MSIDPRYLPATPEAAAAADAAAVRRRVAAIERRSLNTAQAELDANRVAAWQTPSLVNGFANFGGSKAPAGYYKDTFGRVYLRGVVTVSAGDDLARPKTIFTLATGYRPIYEHEFVVAYPFAGSLQSVGIRVKPDGAVQLSEGGAAASGVPFDSIAFRTL